MDLNETPQYSADGRLLRVGADLQHIAFIMDGNGRWANLMGKPREFGHTEGAKAFERVVEYCGDIGVKYVTVYAFSTENWKRPRAEVEKIMSLLEMYLDKLMEKADKYDLRVRFIGDRTPLSEKLIKKIEKAEALTFYRTRTVNIALNYGGRAEMCAAVNKLIREGKTEITEKDISGALYTAECPDPDLIVRTAGEQRLSNFLLWQGAYSEFYFTDTLWPDFGPEGVEAAVNAYYKRTRRFGGLV
ncbi:MAG: di-trans,poly-cis-decaprenylcistransferase [Ruminococcaceae bacterium]|nr:di-trans,poly-cis-decaprenylcistransferase [Oscillospiraceae bacterium]